MIGMVLGLLLVFFFFHERLHLLTDWLPGNRVLLRLQLTDALFTPQALCQLECMGLDTADVRTLKHEGEVRFKYSDTHSEPMRYCVDHRFGDHLVRMTFDADSIASTLSQVEQPNLEKKECLCD
jgi:hypothetical protein